MFIEVGDNIFFICILTREHQNGTMLNHCVWLSVPYFLSLKNTWGQRQEKKPNMINLMSFVWSQIGYFLILFGTQIISNNPENKKKHRSHDQRQVTGEVILSNHPAQAGSPRAGCPGLAFECLRWDTLQPFWATCSIAHHHSKKSFPDAQTASLVLQSVPSGPVTGQHWKGPGSVLLVPSHQVFICTYKIPLNLTSMTLSATPPSSGKLGEGTLMDANNLTGFYRLFGA